MPLAFVLDEHLRGPLWQGILRHNLQGDAFPLDVVRVGDAPELPLSSDDPAVLLWAAREGRILITEDRHTMAAHLRDHLSVGHHSPGILIARAGQSVPALVECLVLIAYAGEEADFADAIFYMP
jgi:Domain of unknown function (DUF5615)